MTLPRDRGLYRRDAVSWRVDAPQMGMTTEFTATLDGDRLSGQAALGAFGTATFEATRA